jgi:hypothetical protein
MSDASEDPDISLFVMVFGNLNNTSQMVIETMTGVTTEAKKATRSLA